MPDSTPDREEMAAFSGRLNGLREKILDLQNRAKPGHESGRGVLEETLQALVMMTEELHVAQEELYQQNEELQAAYVLLEHEQRRYYELFDQAPDAYLVSDMAGLIREANQAAGGLLNRPHTELVGRPLSAYLAPESRAAYQSQVERLAHCGQTAVWEARLNPLNSPPVEAELTGAPACDAENRVTGLRWLLRDITRRREAEALAAQMTEQLRALALRLQSVREGERARIAREIHDELGGLLTGLGLDLARLEMELPASAPGLKERVRELRGLVASAVRSVRRIATDLRPGLLDTMGLVPALEWQRDEFVARTGITCRLTCNVSEVALPEEHVTALFRLFQEMLTNVARHAQATHAEAVFRVQADELVLQVADNGRGISPAEVNNRSSLGLLGMRERVRLLAGDFQIEGRPGRGTTVTIRLPYTPQQIDIEG